MKKKKKKKKQVGGENIIKASIGLVTSMVHLSESIFTEIHAITNIKSDIDNGVSSSPNPPGITTDGPPPFTEPDLD
jgi:hypothetical protein